MLGVQLLEEGGELRFLGRRSVVAHGAVGEWRCGVGRIILRVLELLLLLVLAVAHAQPFPISLLPFTKRTSAGPMSWSGNTRSTQPVANACAGMLP